MAIAKTNWRGKTKLAPADSAYAKEMQSRRQFKESQEA